ncbi:Dimethylglycine oxidase [Geodia barretti]|uniref:Dimethylglycine oxidase n=1 Tax=Geodia barretti TaxID=519541 RepID=A0AA35SVI3_GEOBA|nr:Dimethylglycine oxidase [Geodia barretti]
MADSRFPTKARAVIVGAGIAGCSVAYHLAELGWRNVVVLEQGPLFETGGSTSHAPGLVFQINPSKTMANFASYTVDLWKRLDLDGEPCAKSVGSLEVAWTQERLTDLKRKAGYGMSWGVEAHLIGPSEARDLIPMLSDRIKGALYVPSDIQTKATRPAEAMARFAESNGTAFYSNVEVTGFDIRNGRVIAVKTSHGDVETELVVAAAGIWAPKLGALAGVPIPLSPMQHLYAVTTPLPDLAGATEEVSQPILRHQDESLYFRQVGESYGIGSYRHEPLLVEATEILAHDEAPVAPAEMPFTPSHFEKSMAAAAELLPGLRGAGLTRQGFWSAQAVWITHAGGVGKAVAEWIVTGEPTTDLRECDIRRFHPFAYSRPYVRERAAQQYREVYDIIHPRQQIENPRNIRLTPFYVRQRELGAVFFENAGWERPQWYDTNEGLLDSLTVTGESRSGWEAREWSPTVAAEHVATRERVAMFDLTPFAKFEVTGPGALNALQRLASNQMNKPVGTITYTPMLTATGGSNAT